MQLYRETFQALGSRIELQMWAHEPCVTRQAMRAVRDEVARIESKYSRYRIDSVISRINCAAGHEPVQVDDETAALLNYANAAFDESKGTFDITSGVLRRVWDFRAARVPTAAELKAMLPLVGWKHARWDGREFFLTRRGMEIDFGGFGKEYAVDRAAALCMQAGVTSALLNFGGDVRAIGSQGNGAPWRIGIVHPRLNGAIVSYVELTAGALATSGDYERYFEHDGRRYCHILDPRTLAPVRGFQSVSILAPSCLVAGTLATVAMIAGRRDGAALLRASEIPALTVDQRNVMDGYRWPTTISDSLGGLAA